MERCRTCERQAREQGKGLWGERLGSDAPHPCSEANSRHTTGMTPRQQETIRLLLLVVLLSALGGVFFSLGHGHWQLRGTIQGAFTGAVIGLPLAAFETGLYLRRFAGVLRSASFPVHLLLKTLFYFVVIVLGLQLGRLVVQRPYPGWSGDDVFLSGLLFSFLFSIAFNFVFLVRQMLGTAVFQHFLLGTYHRPREEERIFMFVDVEASTALAERLGPRQFHAFLNRFFCDLSEPIRAAKGLIHQYAGDGVVISWRLTAEVRDAACLQCYFAMCEHLAAVRGRYLSEFGAAPAFRAGLHAGPVVAGEVGNLKTEIVFLGDTVNTAARVLEACKTLGQRLLVSRDLLAHVVLPPDLSVRSFGPVALRGKTEPVELFTVEQHVSGERAALSGQVSPPSS
jgi:adenylate cyclase